MYTYTTWLFRVFSGTVFVRVVSCLNQPMCDKNCIPQHIQAQQVDVSLHCTCPYSSVIAGVFMWICQDISLVCSWDHVRVNTKHDTFRIYKDWIESQRFFLMEWARLRFICSLRYFLHFMRLNNILYVYKLHLLLSNWVKTIPTRNWYSLLIKNLLNVISLSIFPNEVLTYWADGIQRRVHFR